MCHYSSLVFSTLGVRTSERNALHRFRMTARSHQQILILFDCLAASNWPPGHPHSDHHVVIIIITTLFTILFLSVNQRCNRSTQQLL